MIWLLASLAVLGVCLYGLVYAVNAYRRSRYVVNLLTSPVRAAAVGMTEIKGRAVAADETITSPFEEKPCLLCHCLCMHGEVDDDETWFLEAGTLGVPFYVEDETGRLLVRPGGSEVKLPDHLTKVTTEFFGATQDAVGAKKVAPTFVRRFLEQKRNRVHPHLPNERAALLTYFAPAVITMLIGPPAEETIRINEGPDTLDGAPHFVEARLEEGDEVYVLGHTQQRQTEAVAAGDLVYDRGMASQKMVPRNGGEPIEGEYKIPVGLPARAGRRVETEPGDLEQERLI